MSAAQKPLKPYTVHVTFRHPAWNEREGFDVSVQGYSKSDACSAARRQVRNDGHTGVLYFKATEVAG